MCSIFLKKVAKHERLRFILNAFFFFGSQSPYSGISDVVNIKEEEEKNHFPSPTLMGIFFGA